MSDTSNISSSPPPPPPPDTLDAYTGEIRMFGGTFVPRGWIACEGQILNVSEYTDLFALIGSIYGGDGRATFGVPDLRGRLPMHWGNGPGLTPRALGQRFGTMFERLSTNEVPSHSHTVFASNNMGLSSGPGQLLGNTSADVGEIGFVYAPPGQSLTPMNENAIAPAGGTQAHLNVMSGLGIRFIMCARGLFPPRN